MSKSNLNSDVAHDDGTNVLFKGASQGSAVAGKISDDAFSWNGANARFEGASDGGAVGSQKVVSFLMMKTRKKRNKLQ